MQKTNKTSADEVLLAWHSRSAAAVNPHPGLRFRIQTYPKLLRWKNSLVSSSLPGNAGSSVIPSGKCNQTRSLTPSPWNACSRLCAGTRHRAEERSRLRLQERRAAALQQTAASGWQRRLRPSPPASLPFHPLQQPASSRIILLTHAVCSDVQWLDADNIRAFKQQPC